MLKFGKGFACRIYFTNVENDIGGRICAFKCNVPNMNVFENRNMYVMN